MKRKPLFWKLFPTFIVIIGLSLLPFIVITGVFVYEFYKNNTVEVLLSKIDMVAEKRVDLPQSQLEDFFKKISQNSNYIFTIYNQELEPVASSYIEYGDLKLSSPGADVLTAQEKGVGRFEGLQYGLNERFLFVAKKITKKNTSFIYQAGYPVRILRDQLSQLFVNVLLSLILLSVALSFGAWVLSNRISLPLVLIKKHAQKTSSLEEFKKIRLPESVSSETYAVAEAINNMSEQLHKRMKQILRQKNELDALFASMGEGVIAITKESKVLHINQAAIKILDLGSLQIEGLRIDQVIRNLEIQKFIHSAIKEPKSLELELILPEREVLVKFKSSSLLSASGKNSGAVIVVNDITRLRKLEQQRQEFVANVSHELRTPLTLIQGFTETIQNPQVTQIEEVKKFVGIIEKHAKRLQQIIEDLLSLSKLDSDKDSVILERKQVEQIVQSAVEFCKPKAGVKNVELKCIWDSEISAKVNSSLLEQAIINLIDNAVKYSPENSAVEISLLQKEEEVEIRVSDKGPGIPLEHHARLFERFYRIDKARSRNLGGTGLGLSIVKHIALLHKGRVNISSEIGQGSVFSIFFPLS